MDAVEHLQKLRRKGFGGGRIFTDHGRTLTLHYRRAWRGTVDVVLVYGENDAEAYRGDDRIDDEDPFALAWHPELEKTVVGTVEEVVTVVLSWPTPALRRRSPAEQ
jgi:hypothetical protein